MGLTFSVGDLSALIQMLVSMVGLIVAIVTLLVLFRYARDTKRLADMSVQQAEEASVPFLVVLRNDRGYYRIENQGKGPALNITYEIEVNFTSVTYGPGNVLTQGPPNWKPYKSSIRPLGVGAYQELPQLLTVSFVSAKQMVVDYFSLSERRYRTTHEENDGIFSAEFSRLD